MAFTGSKKLRENYVQYIVLKLGFELTQLVLSFALILTRTRWLIISTTDSYNTLPLQSTLVCSKCLESTSGGKTWVYLASRKCNKT